MASIILGSVGAALGGSLAGSAGATVGNFALGVWWDKWLISVSSPPLVH